MSRHAAARRPRSAWLEAWQLAHRARQAGAWLRVEAVEVWAAAAAARWCLVCRRRRWLIVAYYVVAVLAVDTLAMLISGGK